MDTVLEGVDVSIAQTKSIDWSKVKASGKDFAFIKATEASAGVDAALAANIAGCHAAGMLYGEYHFARPSGGDPEAQADLLWAKSGDTMPALGFVLDLETPVDLTGHQLQVVDFGERFVTRMRSLAGRAPLIYSFLSYLVALAPFIGPDSPLRECDIWLAYYGNPIPRLPACYRAPIVIQYSGNNGAMCPGIPDVVDHNRFYGDMAALRDHFGLPPIAPADAPTVPVLPDVSALDEAFEDAEKDRIA